MKDIVRKNPGYADMHVAVAADDWYRGNYIEALKVGCTVYGAGYIVCLVCIVCIVYIVCILGVGCKPMHAV